MARRRRILVLGFFGYRTDHLDGQTVKTRNLFALLEDKCPDDTIAYFDTETLHRNPLMLLRMLWLVCRVDDVIYIPAHSNLSHFSYPLYRLSQLFRFKIVQVVVGGWLADFLQDHPRVRAALAHYDAILTETEIDKHRLEQLFGFRSVQVFPNFRMDDPTVSEGRSVQSDDDRFGIVFMARINKKKGLDWMDALATHLEQHGKAEGATIDFYGPVNSDDESYFSHILSRHPGTMRYMGVLDPSRIVETLSQYDVLVLPTHYYTEGFPGSVLDAYRSGIPVIVTAWLHARQFVKDGETGYIVPFEDGEADLCSKIDLLMRNPGLLGSLKEQALEESLRYTPDAAWRILQRML